MADRRIRLAAFDLDDTLLTTDKQVTPHTRSVLQAAADAGVILMPATGRPYFAVPEPVAALPMVRYILTSNGAAIWDKEQEAVVYSDYIPHDTACRLLDLTAGADVLTEFYSMGRSYACEEGFEKALHAWPRIPDSFKRDLVRYRQPVPDLEARVRSGKYPIEKFRMTFGDAQLQAQITQTLAERCEIQIVRGASYNIELNTPTGTKGHALRAFAEKMGIPIGEVMAFGDSENDLTMIRAAGIGVAMDNALPEVKAVADAVARSNDEDGVAAMIEAVILRGQDHIN